MFTGLVQTVGLVERVEPGRGALALHIRARGLPQPIRTGDSISVSGCCLTVAEEPHPLDEHDVILIFHAVPETLSRTTLGRLGPGSRVNLETSVTPSTLLGGHTVQGHVEGLARVASVQTSGEWRLRLEPPPELMPCIVPKGSVTLDGVSLTVAAGHPGDAQGRGGWFEVALIPTTLEKTTLRELSPGDACNLETDILARTIVHYLRHYAGAPAREDA